MANLKELLDALSNPQRTDEYKYVVLELIADRQNPKAIAPLISIFNDADISSGLRNKIALCLSALIVIDRCKDALEPETAAKTVDVLMKHKALLETENKPTSDQTNALQQIAHVISLLNSGKQ